MVLANTPGVARGSLSKLQPETPRRGPVLPPGGSPKEFAEAALDAVHTAQRRFVPGAEPYYNVYLDRGLGFQGLTAHLLSRRTARWKRKLAFTESSKVYWSITFGREDRSVVTHHRSGYITRFQWA